MLNRRNFIVRTGACAAAVALGDPAGFALSPAARKVVVVGAGIAGLAAAYELLRGGYDVQVLEARMRPGGRIHTLRVPFAEGLYAEVGAIDMSDAYSLVQSYIEEFHLPLTSVPKAPGQVFFANLQRFVVPAGREPDWPFPLSAEERRLGKAGLWDKYVAATALKVGESSAANWPGPSHLAYDRTTLNGFLLASGASPAVLRLLHMSLEGDDFDHVSALQSLAVAAFEARGTQVHSIAGGNDRLPAALAAKLGDRIHYGAAMNSIGQDVSGCRVGFEHAGRQHQIECEHAVLAIPFSVLRHVQMDGSFTQGKRQAISELRYESITSVFLESKRRVWRDAGNAGTAYTDLPIGSVQEIAGSDTSAGGVLVSMTEGMMARKVQAMDKEERIHWTLRYVDQVHPGFAAKFRSGISLVWDEEPWSRGAWSYYAPGDVTHLFPHVRTPEGRIHFAGEHTSMEMTLECAAQSGRRAAAEIANSAVLRGPLGIGSRRV